jgi:hypothetical protein
MRSRLGLTAATLVVALAAGACGGRANDNRSPSTGQPQDDTLAAQKPQSSDTAAAGAMTGPMGDSSAKAHGGTGPTGNQQGGPTGTSPAGTRAASGDSTGKH